MREPQPLRVKRNILKTKSRFMIKTKMTVVGKIFMCLFFFAFGFAICAYNLKAVGEVINNSGVTNNTEVNVGNVKVKDNATLDLTAEPTQDGEVEQEEEPIKKKKFLGIF